MLNFSLTPALLSVVETNSAALQPHDLVVSLIDSGIKEAALNNDFSFWFNIEGYQSNQRITSAASNIVKAYMGRGFNVTYRGEYVALATTENNVELVDEWGRNIGFRDLGLLELSWAFPQMSWREVENISNPSKDKIASLGYNFSANTVYLCQTIGADLRRYTNTAVIRDIELQVKQKSTFGSFKLVYRGPNMSWVDVPTEALNTLYKEVFNELRLKGYDVVFNTNGEVVLLWGNMSASAAVGESVDGILWTYNGGPAGSVYTHNQNIASTIWVINHNLGFIPSVELMNSFSQEFEAEVQHTSVNQTVVLMNVPMTGTARLT